MKTIQLIHYIATHPEFETVVIKDMDDKTPMQAIEILSDGDWEGYNWRINSSLEKGTLLLY